MSKFNRLFVLFFALVLTSLAFAQGVAKGDVDVILKQFKVTMQKTGEVLEPVDRIKPGEVVEYQATYSNKGKQPVRKLLATLPIPAETEYVPGSARPASVQASLDGKTYEAIPVRRKVKLADGKMEERDVPVAQYRSLRWAVDELAAGKKVVVTARIRLEPVGVTGTEAVKK